MSDNLANSSAYSSAELLHLPKHWWPQAGFSSFAYRLAHLALPRTVLTASVFAVFYLM